MPTHPELLKQIEEARALVEEEKRVAQALSDCRWRNIGVTATALCLIAFGIPMTLRKKTMGPLFATFLVGTAADYGLAHFYHCAPERRAVTKFHLDLNKSGKVPQGWESRESFQGGQDPMRRIQEDTVKELGLDPAILKMLNKRMPPPT